MNCVKSVKHAADYNSVDFQSLTMPPGCSPPMSFSNVGFSFSHLSSTSTSYTPEAIRFPPKVVEKGDSLSPGLAEDVADQLEEFLIAVPRLTGQGGGR